ncbi:phosphatase PAP2 family protein [Rhodospirillaceae bacterium KN72]|uniref:Phosphatase PAP2 family protein n=1 Tax=Pacificispira spongiicola TaxID=2729598 RepID=A0A7Y0DXN1_9PROT|nr:phosphatase PAP2 family protein [Pacificispira spongiicola]NMM43497.1 phosphatase PAP2 family protein [Pacificispira spongiicola]
MSITGVISKAGVAACLCLPLLCGMAVAEESGVGRQWLTQPTTFDASTPQTANPQLAAATYTAAAGDCSTSPALCEEDPSPFDKDYLKGFYKVPMAMAARPFDFSKRALVIDAVALGGFGFFYTLDESVRDDATSADSQDTKDFFDTFEPLGDLYTMLAATGGTYIAGELTDSRSLQRIGLNGMQGLAIAAIPVGGTKYLFGRKRPNKNDGNGSWFDGGNSFLSGHTTYAFTVASVVSHEYRDSVWVPWLAYGTASMVGAQRIYADKHWTSDVFISALVGWGVGQAVSDFDYFTADLPIDMQSMTEPDTHGVVLSYKW